VRDGEVVTPPLSSGCLAGITRGLLLECLPSVVEADVPIADLGTCDEAFLTSTSRDVHPIRTIDGRTLARVPGPATVRAQECFALAAAPLAAAEDK
jgi:branched-chain amino acid aminotransferase